MMAFRVNINSLKNAMGTMFLLFAAFFVCSTFMSMRSVLADPIIQQDMITKTSGRASPRSTATTTNRARTTRATTSRATTQPVSRSTASRTATASRTTSSPRASRSNGGATRSTAGATRTVKSRNNVTATRTTNNRAVRARTGATQSRIGATGSVMAGSRASSSATSYTYLSSKLYTGSYSNIIDATTGLIAADAYSNCMESYYACMDEICTARSDTKGRCSCAGRATNFLAAEKALEDANGELIRLSGQLSLLIATKGRGDDIASAFSLTEAEQVMNCVSWKETIDKYGSGSTEAKNWCKVHNMYYDESGKEITECVQPSYCSSANNKFGFDMGSLNNISGSSSDILAQLKAWADAKDLAQQYKMNDNATLESAYTNVSNIVNKSIGISDTETNTTLDTLANKWGYDLFQYAHNNVCGRVLDSCFNGIYEACGNPPTITENNTTLRTKCANGATSNCPYNYNSYVSVKKEDGVSTGEIVLADRTSSSSNASASCFGYTTASASTGTRTVSTSSTSLDPYATLRGPVADARRSIMNKYLLDANAACDTYGEALKKTAQNINYQKIAAEQTLQQKRLEFKQQADSATVSDAKTAINNFNECISEIWDCYTLSEKETSWTNARIKAYCSQVAQVPHCYETMICAHLPTQYVAVIDKPDIDQCKMREDGKDYDYRTDTCRNVVTISEILYGTSDTSVGDITANTTSGSSAALREYCLQRELGCTDDNDAGCLRNWRKSEKQQSQGENN